MDAQGLSSGAIAGEESLALCRENGDQQGITAALNSLGNIADAQGEFEKASTFYEESIKINKESGYRRGVAVGLNNLGLIYIKQRNYERARDLFKEGLEIRRDLAVRLGFVYSLENFGTLATALNNTPRDYSAPQALPAIAPERLRGSASDTITILIMAKLRAQLGEAAFNAWEAGRTLTLEQAIALALALRYNNP